MSQGQIHDLILEWAPVLGKGKLISFLKKIVQWNDVYEFDKKKTMQAIFV